MRCAGFFGLPNEAYCIAKENGGWEVYYSERGNKTDIKVFQNEEASYQYFYDSLKNFDTKTEGTDHWPLTKWLGLLCKEIQGFGRQQGQCLQDLNRHRNKQQADTHAQPGFRPRRYLNAEQSK